jgi:hypothetical protein
MQYLQLDQSSKLSLQQQLMTRPMMLLLRPQQTTQS